MQLSKRDGGVLLAGQHEEGTDVLLRRPSGPLRSPFRDEDLYGVEPQAALSPVDEAAAPRSYPRISARVNRTPGKAAGLTVPSPITRVTSRYPSGAGPRYTSIASAPASTTQYSGTPASA
jgi:hypothetical protein